jgi:hypothetical protein
MNQTWCRRASPYSLFATFPSPSASASASVPPKLGISMSASEGMKALT